VSFLTFTISYYSRWVAFILGVVEFFGYHYLPHYSYLHQWRRAGLDPNHILSLKCKNTEVSSNKDGSVSVVSHNFAGTTRGAWLFEQTVVYVFHNDSSVQISTTTKPTSKLRRLASLPRIGFHMAISKDLHKCTYFGRGPGENYQDRKHGDNTFGVWSSSPNRMGYQYIVPSDNGNRCDCTWASFTNEKGEGIMIVSSSKTLPRTKMGETSTTFDFSALLHNQQEIQSATHTCHLQERQDGEHPIFVNFDSFSMGIGGDIGWGPCVYSQFCLEPSKTYCSR
jgi:hypothetical protein